MVKLRPGKACNRRRNRKLRRFCDNGRLRTLTLNRAGRHPETVRLILKNGETKYNCKTPFDSALSFNFFSRGCKLLKID